MYCKTLLTSALLVAAASATNHEMPAWEAAPAPNVHVAPPAPPAPVHEAPKPVIEPPKHEAAPPVHQVAPPKQEIAPPKHEAAPPVVAPAQNPWEDYKGGQGALKVHLVSVGDNNGSLKYFPDTIHAGVGDIVQFQFHPKNHTVTESTFDEPCKAKDPSLATPQRPGLRSGFIPVTGQEDTTPVYNVLINDTMPIWIFCGQQPHCIRGMSMVINPPAAKPENNIKTYQEKAAQLPLPPTPAGGPPAGGPPAGGSPPAGSPPSAASPPSSGSTGLGASPPAASPPSGGPPANIPAAGAEGSTSTEPAPATFTGAASKSSSSSFMALGALALGFVAML